MLTAIYFPLCPWYFQRQLNKQKLHFLIYKDNLRELEAVAAPHQLAVCWGKRKPTDGYAGCCFCFVPRIACCYPPTLGCWGRGACAAETSRDHATTAEGSDTHNYSNDIERKRERTSRAQKTPSTCRFLKDRPGQSILEIKGCCGRGALVTYDTVSWSFTDEEKSYQPTTRQPG